MKKSETLTICLPISCPQHGIHGICKVIALIFSFYVADNSRTTKNTEGEVDCYSGINTNA